MLGGTNSLVVSGKKRRVGSRGVEKTGLTEAQRELAKAAAVAHARKKATERNEPPPSPEDVNVADRFYCANRSRPLLLLHILEGTAIDADTQIPELGADMEFIALGLSIPPLGEGSPARQVRYRINLVMAREAFPGVFDPTDEEDDIDEEDLS